MIRSALIVLAAASLVPLQAAADPPTAHLPTAFDATIGDYAVDDTSALQNLTYCN